MSDDLGEFLHPGVLAAGLQVSRYTGPERPDGQTRVRVQLSVRHDDGSPAIIDFSIDQWLALGVAIQATAWERPMLPICYDSRCQHHGPPPHGQWPDCPVRER